MDRLLIKQLQSKAQNLAVAEVRPEVSVVVPIYNEVESLPHLIEAIATSLNSTGLSYELICVDDGSQYGSAELLKEQAIAPPNLPSLPRISRKTHLSGEGSNRAWVKNSKGES